MGPVLLLALLLLLTGVATYVSLRRVQDREQNRLATESRAAVTALDQRVDDYAQVLRGVAALYVANGGDVSYPQFHDFIVNQSVMQRFQGVQGIGFASYVPRAGLTAYAREIRRTVRASGIALPPFVVHPTLPPDAQEALVVDRIEPASPASKGFGSNFFSEPKRTAAAQRARRMGRPAATAPIDLVTTGGASLGIDLMVPVFGGPPVHDSIRPWVGVVYAPFRVDNLLRGVLGPPSPETRLEVYDLGPASAVPAGAPVTASAVAFDRRPGAPRDTTDSGRTRISTLDVAGRRWAISYTRTASPLTPSERAVPWGIAVLGALVSLLAAGLLRLLATGRTRAVRLAEEMTVELRQREEELQRSNEELEHFAYLASHDLQEPLRTITSYVGLLESRVGDQLDERARSWLGFVSDGAARMSHLIADLLEYSRTGRARGDVEQVDLNHAWDLAVANLQHAIADAGATVTRGDLPVVQARPREMTSVLQNLIGNGLKYRGEAPPQVTAQARRDDGRWELEISDNGIGIEPRFHDRVFGLFQRLHTSEEYPGTGMGLAIVKKIVESNGGSVRVESVAGKGATFVVTLLPAEDDR
jgi:signal transduction histidine kinase